MAIFFVPISFVPQMHTQLPLNDVPIHCIHNLGMDRQTDRLIIWMVDGQIDRLIDRQIDRDRDRDGDGDRDRDIDRDI